MLGGGLSFLLQDFLDNSKVAIVLSRAGQNVQMLQSYLIGSYTNLY